ncbi:uncharacterized protein EI97DRAFT_64083 [Westerdykella ornata]|uniref:Zn(2)-C6 fungal-type domain-containing protein n=1 Tax=Westerdykella ornata TaxID=318751 RepID=A0A6A6JGT3_WESOR|nr:uncharacterized protein EI97DRAFT_64083 [Westerdykella ornata]KAF2275557.1 hypothetical protein EI97DRAFT_64083 [Westerdykella ornata]
MDSSEGTVDTPGSTNRAAQDNKPKRVRTGCLTCRERHLKCDEGKPICQNCRKSNRTCKTGLRLNFIDIQCTQPSIMAAPGPEYQIAFVDDSRDIASEYEGGLAKYGRVEDNNAPVDRNGLLAQMPNSMGPPQSTPHPNLPPIQAYERQSHRTPSHHHSHSHSESPYTAGASSYSGEQPPARSDARDFLDTQEEVLFMQVFVEEVGLWMDSMDPMKHFSRLLPFHALREPMLLNAFLACGARHLALVNPKYNEDKALHYYDTATTYLLSSLQDPNRNSVICATTAVILNVYEIMCERALQRMNHIAGARALIKECGWNARSTGIGAACFWLNVGMELLSCLHFNWQVAWHPDEWGVDMDFSRETEPGHEEIWTYRIVYIVAKIANFRATVPRNSEQMRAPERCNEWKHLKDLADSWNERVPRTMHPMAYLYPGETLSGSAFPEVWLIKRTAIVARLFYHTAMCLLAQLNPLQSPSDPEMHELQQQHSRFICGIAAHVKDRGVASVALRSLAIAAECLDNRREQEEVLQIFDKIRQETGWRVGFLNEELKEKWGWNNPSQQQPLHHQQQAQHQQQPQQHQQPHHSRTVSGHIHNNDTLPYPRQHYSPAQQQHQSPQPPPPQHPQHHQQLHQQHQHQPQTQPLLPTPSPSHHQSPTQHHPNPTQQHHTNHAQHQHQQHQHQQHQHQQHHQHHPPHQPQPRRPPQGILNPLLSSADFTMPQHPYQPHYVAPNNPVPHFATQNPGAAAAAVASGGTAQAHVHAEQGGYY